jgi:hypothetical protein
MSLRLEMLQVARLAPTLLGEESCALVSGFVRSRIDPGTGLFCGRSGGTDLYYTSFGVDCLTALQADLPPALRATLMTIDPGGLDFVHACCLARLLSAVGAAPPDALYGRIELFRSADGAYHQREGAPTGTAYASLLAYGAYADHRRPVPGGEALPVALAALRCPDGGFANDLDLPLGGTPPSAAALTILRNFQHAVPDDLPGFFFSCFDASGGFRAFRGAPMPDLLSTAVSLHALDGVQADFSGIKDAALDYIDTLWSADGGFHGNWSDDALDVEYTYYGLLALGHLAL